MTRTYQPQQGSIAWKVIQFLTTNPDEKLTTADVSAKFDCNASGVHSMLSQAVATGVLKRETNEDEELEYSLGTGVPSITPSTAAAPSLRAASPFVAAAPQVRRKPQPVDIDGIVIEDQVPIPAGPRNRLTDWPKLLNRLQAGQSCVLPITTKASLQSAITKAHKAQLGEFTLRRVSDEEVRIWRLK